MKNFLKLSLICSLVTASLFYMSGCSDDDDPGPQLTGESKTFDLRPVSNAAISGTVTFAERDDDQVLISIALDGTQAGNTHPAHIHGNSAADGGTILLDLTNVDGASGTSETIVNKLNDGTAITYDELLDFDGYVNVHLSTTDMGTLIAQGDIGQNELTGDKEEYALGSVSDPGISGVATFEKRANGETLVTVSLDGTDAAASHPSHIHANSAAEGGGIVIDLSDINGATGESRTNISELNDGTPITYDQLLDFNGYLNVHLSSTNLGTLVAQGDIGQNELTGDNKVYTMFPVLIPSVTGTTTFAKRRNGSTLVTVALTNTVAGSSHPSHIHANTIAQGGGIVIDLNNVDGTTGMARSNVTQLNDETPITYEELLDFNGYLNVHSGSSFVAQADIGQNELTGESKTYPLSSASDPAISGEVTFAERANGTSLITIELVGTTAGGDHPAHIHANTAEAGGPIILDLKNVNGATGVSATSVSALKSGTAITYDGLLTLNGYVQVHLSSASLATILAKGDIGSNAP